MLAEACENLSDVVSVFFEGVGINQDIVEVDDTEKVEEIAKAIVGVCLH